MSIEERDLIDQKFIEEYHALCRKYNRHLWVDWMEGFNVGEKDTSYDEPISTQADNERYAAAKKQHEEAERQERESQHQKTIQEYVAAGGKLDENGNIPIPKGYCEIIDWGRNV